MPRTTTKPLNGLQSQRDTEGSISGATKKRGWRKLNGWRRNPSSRMLDVHASVDQVSRADDTYFMSLHSTGAYQQVEMKDFFCVREESQCSSGITDTSLTNNRFNGSSAGGFIMDQHSHHDPRMFKAHSWKLPSIIPPQDTGIDGCDARGVKGLVTAIDAIDKIIGPKKPKSKGRSSKARSERSVFCEKCGSTFTSVGNLNRHRRVSHQGVRVFCDFKGCKQVCTPTRKILLHLITQTGGSVRLLKEYSFELSNMFNGSFLSKHSPLVKLRTYHVIVEECTCALQSLNSIRLGQYLRRRFTSRG